MAGQNIYVSFEGSSGENGKIDYTWTFDASKIQNPQDQNLKIDFSEDDLDDIKEEANGASEALEMTMHQNGLIAVPTLTVRLAEEWNADTAVLVKEQDGALARMSDVQVEKSDGTTTLTMSVTSADGICYVVGGVSGTSDGDNSPDSGNQKNNSDLETGDSGSTSDSLSESGNAGTYTGGSSSNGSASSGSSTSKSSNSNGNSTSKNNGSGSSASKGSSSSSKSSNKTSSGKSASGGSVSSASSASGGGSSGGKSSGSEKKTEHTCTISIDCSTILDHMDDLASGKEEFVPSDGKILPKTKVEFKDGDSVFDVLQSTCRANDIQMEFAESPVYGSAYIEGINQLYEFDCGELSGWMYSVNGWFPNYGCSKYSVSDGDEIKFLYTCDLGKDVGDNSSH